ncbi:MAG TPA: M28 family metallopeptidase [Candidatus Polarisedimenticolia bacterium]|nr:M28 family metallopeptidase [Candidatus Polarisedimenticolia bacterium]
MVRRLTAAAALVIAALVIAVGAAPATQDAEGRAEAIARTIPNSASYSRHLLYLTEEPHQTGTPRNMELAAYVRDRFIEYGLEEVHFHDTPALMTYGRSASVDLIDPVALSLKLAEDPVAADKDSYLYRDKGQVPFHGYAADGDVTAEVVYANSGGPEDFAALDALGVEVRGRIVIMRYSDPYSYRGFKVYQAESRGAAGVIIYSDPADDGYARGETYPEGPWGPPSHIQWGAILYDWLGAGEPFTFHWTRGKDGVWKEGPVRDRQLPKIPSLPMSHEDAAEILSRLAGPVVPRGWQGALPFTYHVGPGPARVRLRVDNQEEIGTMRNVIGLIKGSDQPEKWVVLGNHRDAWIYGAVDPASGTAALLEVARALGAALKAGLRPRRTIVFANWDAEEQLLGGSTTWAKEQKERLGADGVAYINVDSAVAGTHFSGGATPALADFLRDATRVVNDPDSGGPLYDAWGSSAPGGVPEVDTIVGATDYTAFQEHIGMSCIDMSFDGPYGVYHSQYDDYRWMSRVGDPGFRYGTTLARLWGVVALRLANADILPMRYSSYARAVPGYLDGIEAKSAPKRTIRLDAARAAAARWGEAAAALEARLDRRASPEGAVPPDVARGVNDLLLAVERAMTEPQGLKGRPFFKHLIYAPQPTYREEILPRLFEAIEAGDFEAIPRHEAELVAAFDHAADLLRRASALIPGQDVSEDTARPAPAASGPSRNSRN